MKDVRLPDLGEGVEEATVSFWHKKEGEEVKEEEDLVELTTEKATFNLPSPVKGKIKKILVKEGEKAKTGALLAEIE